MNIRKKNILSLLVILYLSLISSSNSWANPLISEQLQNLIESKILNSTQKIRVLIQYRPQDRFDQISSSDKKLHGLQLNSHAIRFQQNLMLNTLNAENKVLNLLRTNQKETNAFTLWLANGTLLDLNLAQLKTLSTNQHLSQITWLNRKARLIEDFKTNSGDPISSAKKYTYGLQKIKVPELLKIHPELTGIGVTVGIIDTGIDPNHADLKGKVQRFRDFTNPANKNPKDDHGHGSHVAGTIAGGDASGTAIGVAPEAQLIIAKTFTSSGSSVDENLLKSLQWMADPDGNAETNDRPQIISNSWELDESPYDALNPADEPFCVVIASLSEMGITSVFAAGNSGSGAETINTPASCPMSISVGATDRNDQLTDFSSRGPVRWKNQTLIKPEVSAPGKDIESAEPGGGTRTRSGTSMATPHVAGALALMQQANFDLNLDQLPRFLFDSAKDLGTPAKDNLYGYGRIDIMQAIFLMKTASEKFRAGKIIGQNDFVFVRADRGNIPEKFQNLVESIGWTNYGCTVTHIGNGYALTAGHCFEATAQLQKDKGCSYASVEWGYREGKNPSLKSDCERIVALQNDQKENDFAILKMKSYPKEFAVL